MPGPFFLDDFDTSRLGFVVARYSGHQGLADRTHVTMPLAGTAGLLLTDGRPQIAPRRITVSGTLRADTVAAHRAAAEQLEERATRGTVELRYQDLSRVFRGRCSRCEITPVPLQTRRAVTPVLLEFVCHNPYRYARELTLVAFEATRVPCPTGTAPSALLLRLSGGNNPIVTYRRADGTVAATIGFTVTQAASDYLDVEMDPLLKTVTRYQSGVSSDGLSLPMSGDFFALQPSDGDPMVEVWPTLEVSAGRGEAHYVKAYG